MSAHEKSIELATIAAHAAAEKLAEEIAVIDVSEQLVITDCFVIVSAPTERQVGAIVDEVEDKLREAGVKPIRREGVREGRWALLDCCAYYARRRARLLWFGSPVARLPLSAD